MAREKNSRKSDKPVTDHPMRPGSPTYRMLERIAREIVKSWSEGEAGEDRQSHGDEHGPARPGQSPADQTTKE
jgi:hypothetical protein